MHILLIEDNPADIYLMQEEFDALRGKHRLSVANSIAEAREFVTTERPDAALLDLSLPDSFGLDSFHDLQRQMPELPIIILSGNSDQTMAIDAVRAGAQDYVLKSEMNPDTLLRTLQYSIERASIKTALRRSESRFRRLFDSVPVGVFQADSKGELLTVNAMMVRTLGYDSELEVIRAQRANSLAVNPAERSRIQELLINTGVLEGVEIALYHRAGHEVTVLINAAVVKDEVTGDTTIEGTMVDITERKAAENRLRVQAERDELTGIANRRAFRVISEAFMLRAATDARGVAPAILLFDLDGFKPVNDTLGHAAGDELLKNIAERVARSLRSGDTLARIGGDEFAILCNVAARADVERVAAKVRDVVAEPCDIAGKPVTVGASIGIAMYGEHGDSFDAMLAAADAAMYRAKKAGKGRYAFAPARDSAAGTSGG